MLPRDMFEDDEELKRRNRLMMQSDPVALDDIREEKRMRREALREEAVNTPIASEPERLPGQQANAIEQLRNLPATLGMGDLRRIERDMPEISAPPAIGMGDLRLVERDMPETPVPPRPGIGDLRRVERDMPEVPAASPSPPILGMGDLRRMERDEPRPVLPRNPVEQIKNLPTILDSGSPEREGTAPVLVPEDTTKRGYPNPVPVAPPGDVALSQTPNPVTQTPPPTGTASLLDSIRAENQSTLASLERQGNQQIQEFQSFYQDMLSTLDQRRKDLIAQSEKDKGQLDPDTMAAIDRLKADTEAGLRRVKEEANRRGILDSGIALGMELDVNKGYTQNRTYLENSRLKRIKDNLDAALRSLDDRAVNLRTEGAKTTLGARQRLLDVYGQVANQGNQRLDQESRFMREMGFKQEQSALENLRDLTKLEQDAQRADRDFGLREGQLMGTYGGQPTAAARNQDALRALREGELLGIYNGQPTVGARKIETDVANKARTEADKRDLASREAFEVADLYDYARQPGASRDSALSKAQQAMQEGTIAPATYMRLLQEINRLWPRGSGDQE